MPPMLTMSSFRGFFTAACMMEKAFFILALVFSPSCFRNVVSRSNMASEIFLFSFSQYSKSCAPLIKFISLSLR